MEWPVKPWKQNNIYQTLTFELPEELIAQFPLADRTASRLLHVSKDGKIEDLTFRDILKLLRKDDLLVFNNTKVIKARLNGNKRIRRRGRSDARKNSRRI